MVVNTQVATAFSILLCISLAQPTPCPPSGCPARDDIEFEFIQKRIEVEPILQTATESKRRHQLCEGPHLIKAWGIIKQQPMSKVEVHAELKTGTTPNQDLLSFTQNDLQDYFAAGAEDISQFVKTIGLSNFGCTSLCLKTLEYLTTEGWILPDKRDSECIQFANGVCQDWEDVSDASLEKDATSWNAEDTDWTRPSSDDVTVNDINGSFPQGADQYTDTELAELVAHLFGIYPSEPEDTVISFIQAPPTFGSQVRGDRRSIYVDIFAKAEAWMENAIAKMPGNIDLMQRWFKSTSDATQKEVRRVMLFTQKVLNMAKLVVGDGVNDMFKGEITCDRSGNTGTLAYVGTSCRSWDNWKTKTCGGQKDGNRYVIHMCEWFWNSAFANDEKTRYGTMVHEAVHHAGPSDDKWGGDPYGMDNILKMPRANSLNNAQNFMMYVYELVKSSGGTPVCKDSDSGCVQWAGNGECTTGEYVQWMKENCKLSCKVCGGSTPTPVPTPVPTPPATACKDSEAGCIAWAGNGECTTGEYVQWMKENCKLSCKICGGSTPTPVPTPVPTPPATACTDSAGSGCISWAGSGLCTTGASVQWMKENCKLSCNACGGSGGSCVTQNACSFQFTSCPKNTKVKFSCNSAWNIITLTIEGTLSNPSLPCTTCGQHTVS